MVISTGLAGSLLAGPESNSRGTPANGSLEGGVSMPTSGDGFVTYSRLGNWLGRQYVNSRVRDTLLAAFAALHVAEPTRVLVLGETGWKRGGRFRPHRTHQNGLSVDIFMPVRNRLGRSVPMPTAPWNRFGYGLEFDREGRCGDLTIDFRGVADLLEELDRQAAERDLKIDRIIVAPEYVGRILKAGKADAMSRLSGRFIRTPAWVRHDEHVHVDFRVEASAPSLTATGTLVVGCSSCGLSLQ